MTSSPERGDEPEPLELPPPKPTLLQRLALWVEHANALKGWAQEARKSSGALDATFETIERDSRIGGGMLAGALSYRPFLFVLPLAFFIVSGLGLLESAVGVHPDVIVNSTGFAGIVTSQVASASKGSSSWWVALTSFIVLVYATRVLLRAVVIVHSLAWEGSGVAVKVSSRMLEIFGAGLVAIVLLGVGAGAVNHQSAIGGIFALVVFVLALAGVWLVVSMHLPNSTARWTNLLPGSLFFAIGIFFVQVFNVLILSSMLESKSSTYGALGIAASLLIGFFLVGRVIVGATVLNVTLYERHSSP